MKRVVVVAFDGAQTLDVTGPSEVFAMAARLAGRRLYQVIFASSGRDRRGLVTTTSGLTMHTEDLGEHAPKRGDTIIVAGGEEAAVRRAAGDLALRRWLLRARRVVERMASVCSGAFVLAQAGLLEGRRATTHWAGCDALAAAFRGVTVDRNAIFVRDGNVWTSAGITTGIDMALAMVEADHGRSLADLVARRLVLYARRPGFQSQFSTVLVAQTAAPDMLAAAIDWARGHLAEANVERLAKEAGLSMRTLHRRCAESLSTTPAKLLEKLRVEQARTLLSTSACSVKELAVDCGFRSPARMKRAFERELGVGPREYRLLFSGSPPPARSPSEPRTRRAASGART